MPFTSYNVDEDEHAYDELIARGFRTVPVTVIGDTRAQGLQPRRARATPSRSGGGSRNAAPDRHEIGQQRVGGLREPAAPLHDGDLSQQIRGQDDRVLLAFDLRQRIVAGKFLQRDARRDTTRLTRRARHELQRRPRLVASIARAAASGVMP